MKMELDRVREGVGTCRVQYNERWQHSALRFLCRVDYYRGNSKGQLPDTEPVVSCLSSSKAGVSRVAVASLQSYASQAEHEKEHALATLHVRP